MTLTHFIADGAPEGIHIETGNANVIDQVIFPIVCEKAVRQGNNAKSAATNTLVRNSKFYTGAGPADHSILVKGGSITVQNCYFKSPRAAISSCGENANPGFHPAGKCEVPSKITATGNEVDGCSDYGMQSAGHDGPQGGYFNAIGNTFSGCKTPLRIQEQGIMTASNNIFYSPCDQALFSQDSTDSATFGCGNRVGCKKDTAGPK